MSYDHSLCGNGSLKEGVALNQLVDALAPLFEYLGIDGEKAFLGTAKVPMGFEFYYLPESRAFSLNTYGEVGWSFDDAVEACCNGLCSIVDAAGSMRLVNHDTGDIDNAVSEYFFGPTSEAIEQYSFDGDMAEIRGLLSAHLADTAVDQLVAQICDAFAKSSQKEVIA